MGEVDDERALDGYLYDPFHQKAVAAWREISDWIVADLRDADAAKTP
jgi:hypothetical protein